MCDGMMESHDQDLADLIQKGGALTSPFLKLLVTTLFLGVHEEEPLRQMLCVERAGVCAADSKEL